MVGGSVKVSTPVPLFVGLVSKNATCSIATYNAESSMTTYESGDAEGPPGRHPARGARAGAAPRLRDHGSAADKQRRPDRPADRHGVSGLAPPGAGRPG